ncbi:MAG: 2-oxoglutarate:acceptor oxidoreductase [Campylobacteraceae bacterium 4484_4]|nr:MAG: 2-oxoglutarate:acceptor oxidoreductase [Campylobacteraceae bacterium 4484_4]
MRHQLRFTGVGGQGVLLAGEILAAAKISEGGYGVKAATYTSQVRGGPTVVDILLDDKEILFPYAIDGEIEFMLSVAQVSYDQFKNGVKDGGIIVVDPDLVHPSEEDRKRWKIYEIPIIRVAKYEVGNVVTQSVVALAIAIEMTHVMDAQKVLETMKKKVPPKVLDANIKAWELGTKYAKMALAGEKIEVAERV